MKITAQSALAILLLVSSGPPSVQAAASTSANVCLNASNVQRTEAVDDRTILFHMRDGKVWRNTLKSICPMLKVSPFSQVLRSGDLICANQQFIHVAMTGNTCALGDFTQISPPH